MILKKEKKKERQKIKKSEWIAFWIVLVVTAVLLIIMYRPKPKGAVVAVYEKGEKIAEFSLSEDGRYQIDTDRGENVLVIKDGAAYMESADCPDKVCVDMGKIENQDDNIICIPHGLVFQVEGESTEEEYDIR